MLKEVNCPACRRLAPWQGNPHRPFCSERCRMHDLGNWASEGYRIAGDPAEPPLAEDDDRDDDTE
ncbi:MAG TPA: DNA gyrase inhibitor YacG [Candidatus Binatia bacterium]|jgi:uncharacterized protein